jgi:hypothetical protein
VKKTFSFEAPRHAPARVVERIKHEVRKYLKRERRKALPDDAEYWAFDCHVGQDGPSRALHANEIPAAIDAAVADGWSTIYVEIHARAAQGKQDAKHADDDHGSSSTSG